MGRVSADLTAQSPAPRGTAGPASRAQSSGPGEPQGGGVGQGRVTKHGVGGLGSTTRKEEFVGSRWEDVPGRRRKQPNSKPGPQERAELAH